MLDFGGQCIAGLCIGTILLVLTSGIGAQGLPAFGDDGLIQVRSV